MLFWKDVFREINNACKYYTLKKITIQVKKLNNKQKMYVVRGARGNLVVAHTTF